MTKQVDAKNLGLEELKHTDPAGLAEIFAEFNRTTERLRQSHESLQKKVAELSADLARKNEELRLKSRLAAIGEMAAAVAHEVRNPLGAIELYASMLEQDLRQAPAQFNLVGKILAGVKTLERTVQNLLAFTGPQQVEKKRCDISEVVREAFALAVPERSSKVSLDLDIRPSPLWAQIDPDQMQRAFINIIQNAAQAMAGGGILSVQGKLTDDEPRRASIAFIDTGLGIPSEIIGKIFTPFFSARQKGLGLGLSLAQRIVEGHGGTISARNLPPRGACFTITIPAE